MYPRVPIIVRFSTALPDIPLAIEEPQHTSVLSLICQIRSRLSAPHDVLRIRLIYSGRVLGLDSSLAEALRLQPDAPSSSASSKTHAKGKAPLLPTAASDRNYYVHVSFSDALDSSQLEKERVDASSADAKLSSVEEDEAPSPVDGKGPAGASLGESRRKRAQLAGTSGAGASSQAPTSPASQMPQGFDRLLSAGLSALEVASLRSQFTAILAHTHTPDTMPNAYELRQLEEQWLDNDAEGMPGVRGGGGADALGQADGAGGLFGRLGGNVADEDSSGLDDMLWGNLMGFFWPVGAMVWLMREEGVWTQRRKIAVVTGALVNLAFSIMRAAS